MLLKPLLREPLVHFLLLGTVLFAAHGALGKRATAEPGKIVVSQLRIDHLTQGFARTWLRVPTAEELEGLIRDYIREEVYYREAMAMGLDRDDTIIRRRLKQKLEFLSENITDLSPPTDEELRAFLQSHQDQFRSERRFTFHQVYLSPERHRDGLAGDAAELLRQLKRSGNSSDTSSPGDPSLLEHQFANVEATEVAKQFGEKFASALSDLPLREWQGPVESSYGIHLVFVDERTERRSPALEEVRDAVRRELLNVRRLESNKKFYDGLRKRYTISIEPAPATTSDAKMSVAK
ncbi:peptidyl-prolyl cis-trans isomerase [Bradyrhizobium sp. CCBAU 11386]|uniref:peptidyl-prolyl cis-trans isomerase n=1 Tax=Bradyrhizobium sp. CCBAU 11386 TaxID=1630837 RepID=UPI002304A0CA|nr:peptidyl-prolyl cis-trans isomerase [Bradyrhizobium sp. CCBAU 11386]